MKTVTKRVEGTGKIPKYNVYPPLQINDTESFFAQLRNVGFVVKDVEEKKLFPSQVKQMEEQKKEESKQEVKVEVKQEEPVVETAPEVIEEKVEESKQEFRPNNKRNTRKPRQ